ncbi:MAG: pyruvate oxidase [Kiritimatiellia bacterium]|jgi:pyruvate oxidase
MTRTWHKVAELDELPDGRVKSITCSLRRFCLTHHNGVYAALDDACPHQGGPLGEGSIENGLLRCPWHGWDFDPTTGRSPGSFGDGVATHPIEVREDGVYVAVLDLEPHERTCSDVVAETLVNWGIDSVFGMVGHSNLGMADALRRQEQAGALRYIGIRHEGAAAFAASAYGKLTGRPAVCFAIAGPGATNLLTGLWDAHVDRSPVLALTGQVPTKLIGRGAFQEVDLVAAFGGVAVWSGQTSATSDHGELTTIACKSALVRRGVSHLVLPDEVQVKAADGAKAGSPRGRVAAQGIAPAVESLKAAVDLLGAARRPAIVVGHGARFAMDQVIALAEQLNCPVMTTFKAKGQISDSHRCGCGVLGRSGTPVASWVMNEADALLVLGASFSNHTGISSKTPTVQVDIDPMQLGRFHAVDVPVWGEIAVTLGLLSARLTENVAQDQTSDIAARWAIWRDEKQARLAEEGTHGLSSAVIFEALTRAIPGDAIIPVDVGNNTYSFGRYFECDRQTVLMSGYLGSIGFGLPAALGAWAATQGKDPRFSGRAVVSISGDGGLGQYLAEITTAVQYDMNITHVVVNNGELGKISKEQRTGNWQVWQTSLSNPSFAAYATECGALGIKVQTREELDAALIRAIGHHGPALVEIIADAALL